MPLSNNVFRSRQHVGHLLGAAGRSLLPSVDGSMLAIGSEPAVEALPRHRRVLEKSTATMQYEKRVNNPTI
jgi:hypothetical protein